MRPCRSGAPVARISQGGSDNADSLASKAEASGCGAHRSLMDVREGCGVSGRVSGGSPASRWPGAPFRKAREYLAGTGAGVAFRRRRSGGGHQGHPRAIRSVSSRLCHFFLFDIFAEARPKPGVGALAGYAHDLPIQRQDIDREFCPGQICRSESVNCQEIERAFEHGSVWRRPAKVKLGIYGWIFLS